MKKKQKFEDYYLGLDIGTNSVGWAVTDESYNLLKFNKKDMWGARLFEEAKTAQERRISRGTRRRLERRNNRLKLLDEIFEKELEKVDENFLLKLKESNLHREDRTSSDLYPIFNGEYTDKEYFKNYPTIYHLRQELIKKDEKFDIRLLYLATHHIIKYRGHFIFEGQSFEQINDFKELYNDVKIHLADRFDYNLILEDSKDIKSIICNTAGLLKKAQELKKYIKDESILNFFKASVGSKVKADKIFGIEEYADVEIHFPSIDEYDAKRSEWESVLGEDISLIDWAKRIYDFMILDKILEGGDTLSESKIKVYEKHGKDLKNLKYLFKKYLTKEDYDKFFRDEKISANYTTYINSPKNCKIDDLLKEIKKFLDRIKPNSSDDENLILSIENDINSRRFLEKLKTSDNGNIPYQVHEMELKKILLKQSKYHTFLNEVSDGYSNIEKIIMLLKFRVPYYVGPLNTDKNVLGKNTWVVRRDEENKSKITPWNFDEKIDKEKSAENFIMRMTNKCTYLSDEDVLPKKSILYSEYMLLNELNKVKIDGNFINVDLKNEIISELFKKEIRITKNKFIEFLKIKQIEFDTKNISGILNEFNAKLESYNKFEKIIGDKIETNEGLNLVENCIRYKCLYGTDTKLFKKAIEKQFGDFVTDTELNKISKLKFSEWGRLSKKLLCNISFENKFTKEEYKNVMEALRITNHNLMELLSPNFTLGETIEKLNAKKINKNFDIENYVDELYISPMLKRSIIQTYSILNELKNITNKNPKKIFIEVARGGIDPVTNKDKRKNKILKLYLNAKDSIGEMANDIVALTNNLDSFDDNRLRQKKLFLYFMQLGKSMYSGEDIDLNKLFNTNIYDIDHIYPRSKVKDDSFDNIVLVEKQINSDKSNKLLDHSTQQKMNSFWKYLRDKEFITKEKYYRLTRKNEFTKQELSGFINRQLVATRQSTIEIINLLKLIFPDSEIIYTKSSLTSDFREKFKILKVRELNDTHHAQDAYLNIVVGNVYNAMYTKQFWKKDEILKYNFRNTFKEDVILGGKIIWKTELSPWIVKNNANRKTINLTRMIIEGKGKLFDLTIKKKEMVKGKEIIPNKPSKLRKNLEDLSIAAKYGYYGSLNPAYFMTFKHTKKGKRIVGFDRVCINEKNEIKNRDDIENLLIKKGYENPEFIRKVHINQLITVAGFPYRIRGFSSGLELMNNQVLYLDDKFLKVAKDAVRIISENPNGDKKDKIKIHFEQKTKEEKNETYEEALERLNNDFIELFDELVRKMQDKSYKNYLHTQKMITIKNSKEYFIKLGLIDKAKSIVGIFQFLGKNNSASNLKMLNLSDRYGRISGKNFESLYKNKIIIIDESVTGLFIKKEEL